MRFFIRYWMERRQYWSVFQFSLWDSRNSSAKAMNIDIAFNSLYEIRWRYLSLNNSAEGIFQFSLWDSLFGSTGNNVRFRKTFNSLYEILKTNFNNTVSCRVLSILFMRFKYEVTVKGNRVLLCFQFSLWDSNGYSFTFRASKITSFNSLYEILTKNQNLCHATKLSILFMRFEEALKRQKLLLPIFQFSLWDSFLTIKITFMKEKIKLSILFMRFS